MDKLLCLLLLPFVGLFAFSQPPYEARDYRHQISLRHDNDFMLLTDRYFSSGLYLSYLTTVKNNLIKGYEEQLAFTISQEIYTPSQTQSTDSQLFDRPYAGFLGLGARFTVATKNHLYGIALMSGIAGLNSGAGGFQRWYHRVIAISDAPIWTDELYNSLHSNLYVDYIREWTVLPNPFGIRFALTPKMAFGSRDIFVEPWALLSLGRRSHLSKSIAFT